MKILLSTVMLALIGLAAPALADFQKVQTRSAFMALVGGKALTRPLVRINVLPNGKIAGKGAAWDVTGNWQWKNGYLCRKLEWGGDDLGYNCQEVAVKGRTVRITSDMGSGDSAEFTLR